jgi:hypothetical protein
MAQKLLDNQTGNGSGTEITIEDGGTKILRLFGTFDGATAQLEFDIADSGVWTPDSSGAFTAADAYVFNTKAGLQVRMTVSGSGGSTNISAELL